MEEIGQASFHIQSRHDMVLTVMMVYMHDAFIVEEVGHVPFRIQS